MYLSVFNTMIEEKPKMTRLTITVPEKLLEEFKQYCDKEFRPVSTQLQYMMKKALEEDSKQNRK